MVPKIISDYNEETKQFSYILEGNTCNYNLNRLLAMPKVSDTFSSFQYRKENVFCTKVIKKSSWKMVSIIPENILNKFIYLMDINANTEDIESRFNLSYTALSMYIEDDIAHKEVPVIFFDFNKYKHGCKKSGKFVILDEYYITVERYPGVVDEDHPDNEMMYTVYHIIDRNDTDKFICVIIGENYNTKFMIDNLPTYPAVSEKVKEIIHFDPNHIVHHYTIIYANSFNEGAFVQAIDIVKDMDNMAGIHLLDNHFEPSITKIIMSIGDEVPENLQRIKSLVNYDELENSHVYDLFGNYATFKQLKDSISIRRD